MVKVRKAVIADLEESLVAIHRREMRLRSILRSALASSEYRKEARIELEKLLEETRAIQEKVARLEDDK
jgi:hypothetical protein